MRKYIPLPHETLLRKRLTPITEIYVKKLIHMEECQSIINNFIEDEILKNELHVTLAVDAAAFKSIKGSNILRKFHQLSNIIMNNTYNNLFVFFCSTFKHKNQTFSCSY